MTSLNIGRNVLTLREARGMTLTQLAREAGIGKGTLSEIESGKRNPTVETLYSLCAPLNVPLTALVGDSPGAVSEASGGMRTTLLSVRRNATQTVEVFIIAIPKGAAHTSPGHGPGVVEHLVVTEGSLEVGPVGKTVTVEAGNSFTWTSDDRHHYASPESSGEGVLTIITPNP
ncbi:helix-turn-helix domain-containing protein [Arthrobacter sp. NPDC090010]|uniref:helix-turn-helix domain-containing protein n=1 Tax=Arthrobacter sp. NPDC090010 TaxID=3363942 RepID=UPI0037F4EE14